MSSTSSTHRSEPWHVLWRSHGHAIRGIRGWGSMTLTLLLLGIGVFILWIALRGSDRLKAATAVWTLFP